MQVPALFIVNCAPAFVQMLGLPELKDTGSPELAVAATVKVVPTGANAGAACVTEINWLSLLTVSVNGCVAFGSTPLLAVMDRGNTPPAVGVPPSVAVPLPLSTNVTPAGSAPDLLTAAVGNPVVVTVNDPDEPTANVVAFALVTAGAWLTVSVNDCVAFGRTPLLAV